MSERPRVLLVSPPGKSSFIDQDFRCLAGRYDAVCHVWRGAGGIPALWWEIARADAVLIWFAARHAIPAVTWARLLRVPVATIVGGYEAAWLPDIPYGIPPESPWRTIIRWILRHSTLVLTVSGISDKATRGLMGKSRPPVRLIHNAVDTGHFRINPSLARRTILTVAHFNCTTIRVKGLRLFWETAARMPDEEFVAVGPAADTHAQEFVAHSPPNLRWLGPLYGEELLLQFQRAKVYFQGSLHESFSVATVEAMACGCIPVVSRNGALPEVAGDAAVYLETLSPDAAVKAIQTAFALPETRRDRARARAVDRFSLTRRRRQLYEVIDDMLSGHRIDTIAAGSSPEKSP